MKDAINASLLDMVKGLGHFLVQLATSPLWKSIMVFAAVILLLGGAILSIIVVISAPFVTVDIMRADYAGKPVKEQVIALARITCACLVLLGVAAFCIFLIRFPVSWL